VQTKALASKGRKGASEGTYWQGQEGCWQEGVPAGRVLVRGCADAGEGREGAGKHVGEGRKGTGEGTGKRLDYTVRF
jgi:hypothetical protein